MLTRRQGDIDDVTPLNVCRTHLEGTDTPVIVSCWKVTPEELAEINRTGRVWLQLIGERMVPALLSGTNPFANGDGNANPS